MTVKNSSTATSGQLNPSNTEKQPDFEGSPDLETYSVWSGRERAFIVFVAATAAVFSPLSANIYYPILNILAADLKVSNTLINITVSTYMIVQGLAPTIIAGASDVIGRRPAYLLCFIIYFAANIGLALQRNYVALALLRCLQSAGSSSTVALASAIVADLAPSSKRGKYSAFTSSAIFIGPSIGPVIGGALSSLGWPAVFWFLAISSGIFLLLITITLPETCRQIVGNGSQSPPWCNMSLVSAIRHRSTGHTFSTAVQRSTNSLGGLTRSKTPTRMIDIFKSTTVLTDRELSIITVAAGLPFAAFYAVCTSIPSVFGTTYGLDNFQIGLCFLTNGAGCLGSCLLQGKLVDQNFKRYCLLSGRRVQDGARQDLSDFPVEKARVEVALPAIVVCAATVLGYGWSIDQEVSIVAPLTFVFFISLTSTLALNVLMILVIDIWNGRPAIASAGTNLVRCLLGAAATAAVAPMINSLGRGWAFTTIAVLTLGPVPLLVICMQRGMQWRSAKERVSEG